MARAFGVGHWQLALYPTAFEAGGSFVSRGRPSPHGYGVRGAAADPARSRAEAARRARGKVRRYCAANRLNRLGTLTYRGEGCHDPRQVRADLGMFFRDLRTVLGGKALPYVWVPELHKTGHGFHAHFAVGRYVKQSLLQDVWSHGWVSIKLLGDLPVGSTARDEARRAAGYLSKYVAKTFQHDGEDGGPVIDGRHRYDLAQGFQPPVERITASTFEDLRLDACERLGAYPAREWYSWQTEDWQGPAALWFQWA